MTMSPGQRLRGIALGILAAGCTPSQVDSNAVQSNTPVQAIVQGVINAARADSGYIQSDIAIILRDARPELMSGAGGNEAMADISAYAVKQGLLRPGQPLPVPADIAEIVKYDRANFNVPADAPLPRALRLEILASNTFMSGLLASQKCRSSEDCLKKSLQENDNIRKLLGELYLLTNGGPAPLAQYAR